jgi:hypothetical protein
MKKTITLFIAALIITATTMAQTVPNYVPNNGLVGWWPFNGNANDISGNGNNGTVNGASLTADRNSISNTAYSFNGTSNYIQINLINALNTANINGLTLSGWTNMTSLSNQPQSIIFMVDNLNNGFNTGYDYTSTKLYGQAGNAGVGAPMFISSLNTVSSNNWYNVVLTCDFNANTSKLYINGVLQSQSSVTLITTILTKIFIGRGPNPFWYQNGKLDDIGIWNRTLDSCEIKDLYFGSLGNCCNNAVTTQPINQTVLSGTSAVFTLSAAVGSALQWQTNLGVGYQNLSNAGQYSGVNTATLTVSNVGVNNSNQAFRCIVGSGSCSDTSNVATLSLSTVGIAELNRESVSIYPNPASTSINVRINTAFIDNGMLELYDATGKLIMQQKVVNEYSSLNLNGLANGIYSVRVITDNEQTIKRIVKQQ